jgi:hypothetical protein
MKVRMLLDGGAPKVPPSDLRRVIQSAGMEVSDGRADFGVVVGGDGRFSWYGRTEDIPLLFVGVRSKGATGSKAHLARTTFDELPRALRRIRNGDYSLDLQPRLAVRKNRQNIGEVFTDAYLQRGSDSTCIRYRVRVRSRGVRIEEAAIGDGVVISTMAGSTGYYSYPDRIRGELMDPEAFATFGKDEVGICHITPTYTERDGSDVHPRRYTVPWGSRIVLALFRKADARLYGTTDSRAGVRVGLGDEIVVLPARKKTKVISL